MAAIMIGVLLIGAGAIGIYSGYSGSDWAIASAGWAGVIIGALATLFGFGKRASETVASPHREVTEHANIEMRALVQSMGVVAVADAKIRDLEIETIINVYDQMLGVRISPEDVRKILGEFGPGFDITKMLTQNRSKISPTMKRTIVQCCHLVMISDKEVVKTEQHRVKEIGLALGFDQSEIEDMISSAGL
jgi:uncharacterized tellurite resistance protein B-like protein